MTGNYSVAGVWTAQLEPSSYSGCLLTTLSALSSCLMPFNNFFTNSLASLSCFGGQPLSEVPNSKTSLFSYSPSPHALTVEIAQWIYSPDRDSLPSWITYLTSCHSSSCLDTLWVLQFFLIALVLPLECCLMFFQTIFLFFGFLSSFHLNLHVAIPTITILDMFGF